MLDNNEEFKKKFIKFITGLQESVLEPISAERIVGTFTTQGYFATDGFRIYYDDRQGFVAQPRLFGKQ